MSKDKKATKAEKQAAKAEKKALKAAKKVAKAEKQAKKAAKKMAKKQKKAGKAPVAAAPVTKKATVFGHPVRNLLIAALIAVVLGVVFLVKPSLVYTYITYAVGGLMALFGLVYIILYFARKQYSGEYHYEFGFGLVAVLAGAYVALGSLILADAALQITFTVICQLIGLAIALDGILKLQYMLDLARMGYKKWWIVLITSVLGIAMGVAMAFFMDYVTALYYTTGIPVMTILGAAYCLNAVLDLIAMTVVAVRNHKANKAAALAEAEAKVAASVAAEEEEKEIEEEPEEIVIVIPAEEPVIEAPVMEQPPVEEEPVVEEPAQAAVAEE